MLEDWRLRLLLECLQLLLCHRLLPAGLLLLLLLGGLGVRVDVPVGVDRSGHHQQRIDDPDDGEGERDAQRDCGQENNREGCFYDAAL